MISERAKNVQGTRADHKKSVGMNEMGRVGATSSIVRGIVSKSTSEEEERKRREEPTNFRVDECGRKMAPRMKKKSAKKKGKPKEVMPKYNFNEDGTWGMDTKVTGERFVSSSSMTPVVHNRTGRTLKPPYAEALARLFNVGLKAGEIDQDTVSMLFYAFEVIAKKEEKLRVKAMIKEFQVLGLTYSTPLTEKSLGDPCWMIVMKFLSEAQSQRFLKVLERTDLSGCDNLHDALVKILKKFPNFKKAEKTLEEEKKQKAKVKPPPVASMDVSSDEESTDDEEDDDDEESVVVKKKPARVSLGSGKKGLGQKKKRKLEAQEVASFMKAWIKDIAAGVQSDDEEDDEESE